MAVKRVCYKCPDRVAGCHSTCERYLAEKAEYDLDKEIRDLERAALAYSYDRTDKRRSRSAKRKMQLNRFKNRT